MSHSYFTCILDVVLLTFCASVVAMSSPDNLSVFVILAPLCTMRLVIFGDRACVLYFLTGALVGASFDVLRVQREVYTYTNPDIFGFPAFMPIVWGQIFMTIRNMMTMVDRKLGVSWVGASASRERVALILIFTISVPALSVLHEHPLLAILVAVGGFLTFLVLAGRPGDPQIGLLFAVLGPGFEVLFVSTELYQFEAHHSIPLWLPVFWMLYALVIRRAIGILEPWFAGHVTAKEQRT